MNPLNNDSILINKRYQLLKQIGQGGMGQVYRAYDRFNQQTVALKLISIHTAALDFATKAQSVDLRLALAGEFRTLSSLRHPNIISVLDYGFDEQKQPFYTMELLENAENILAAARDKTYSEQLELLAQILHALDFLHRRGIIHRDLKPENILVSNGQVYILDFGLALEKSAAEKSDDTAGTIYYLAPELMSAGHPSIASDMYALGLICYEMFAGKLPFPNENLGQFILASMTQEPKLDELEVDEALREMIGKLLIKNPKERFQDVHGMLKSLIELEPALAVYDSISMRESFLQSASFTGRDVEMSQLLQALTITLQDRGSACFVTGESGIGKSRLLDELRTHALVDGVQVMRGQATTESAHPYALWLNILRHLLLMVDVDDLDAAIFKAVLPDMDKLLERPIADIARLAPEAERSRFIASIIRLIQGIKRPSLIILEDLHWASEQSLELLRMLIPQTQSLPLMIVGSYRADEATESLTKLQGIQEIRLKRLPQESIQVLSAAMIGEAAQENQLIELLEKESEGNIYFLIEIIRALAEEAGNLEDIRQMTLPRQILTGGMISLLRRRLSRISQKSLSILQLAAVAGRQLDLELLASLLEQQGLSDCLEEAANALILEFFEENWRFVHDKLRETLLSDLSPELKSSYHRQLAEALQKIRGEAAAPALVYHWHLAGNSEREAYWSTIAGSKALQIGAYSEALIYLHKALPLYNSFRLQRQLGQAYYGLGDLKAARKHLDEALLYLGQKLPQQLIFSILKELGRHTLHRQGLRIQAKADDENRLEAARIYGLLGEISYFTTETTLGVYSVLKMLNLASGSKPSPELAQAHINLCIAAGFIPHYRLAEHYGNEAIRIAKTIQHDNSLMRILNTYAVYFVGTGQWQRGKEALDEAYLLATKLGDKREANQTFTTRAVMLHYQGKLEEASQYNSEAAEMARMIGNKQQLRWGVYSHAENMNNLALYDKAKELLAEALRVNEGENAKSSTIRILTAQAIAHLRLREFESALQAIQQAREILGKTAPNVYSMLESYAAFADIYLSLAEEKSILIDSATALEKAKEGISILKSYSRLYPIGKARYSLWQGRLQMLEGFPEKAQSSYEEALSLSRQIEMAYEETLVQSYIHKLGSEPKIATIENEASRE